MTSSYAEVCFRSKADLVPPTSYVRLVPSAELAPQPIYEAVHVTVVKHSIG